jgi:DNA-binding response OmpR family regulator
MMNPFGHGVEPRARARAGTADAVGRPARILVVEDDTDTRQLLVVALGAEKYVVDHAATADEGLERLRGQRYDLVLTDYELPGKTGAAMLKQAAQEGIAVRAALVTAHTLIDGVEGTELIRKPLDLPPFLRQVRRILGAMPDEPLGAASGAPSVGAASSALEPHVDLVLYVSADSPASLRARHHLETLLASFEPSQVALEICDVSVDPARGESDHVVFTPTLVSRCGGLATWVLGDLADRNMLLELLQVCGLEPKNGHRRERQK